MHQTCTRLARADYCGIGRSSTHDNTEINVWDRLPMPGPIQGHEQQADMVFEAGWDPGGAVCLSRSRWLLDDTRLLVSLCPHRLVAPGIGVLGATVCNSVPAVLGLNSHALLFNEAHLNLLGL
jgi:hypothetical protein